ncbi:putative dihydrofolate synthase [Rhizodiscina lignyota]|uniref:tetrahydrofolate synthase n=1 Tax=Rhizodiscina lignyota TaxID=1504668 RepID=A0A9P4MD99_9PEZI|nr:putative dihydrofolate synthase [Rhizodiscina lignyota]
MILGFEPSHLDRMNAIHCAGTNGKGSVCAVANHLLNCYRDIYGWPTAIGLYTSPHLSSVCERFRVNGTIISEDMFAKCFFEVYQKLEASEVPLAEFPSYARFLTLVALHLFDSVGVDAAIIETGIGGKFDSTNVFDQPKVTVISEISRDHTISLGDTLEEISQHKSGIFKPQCPAISVQQKKVVEDTLRQRAEEKDVHLDFVGIHKALQGSSMNEIQLRNASAGIISVERFLSSFGRSLELDEEELVRIAEHAQLPGRFHKLVQGDITWCIDGGHNEGALEVSSEWFAQLVKEKEAWDSYQVVLIFNQESVRDVRQLLRTIHRVVYKYDLHFSHAIFCTNAVRASDVNQLDLVDLNKDIRRIERLVGQNENAAFWRKDLDQNTVVHVRRTIEEAMEIVLRVGKGQIVKVFATGSLRIAGGLIDCLKIEETLDGAHLRV